MHACVRDCVRMHLHSQVCPGCSYDCSSRLHSIVARCMHASMHVPRCRHCFHMVFLVDLLIPPSVCPSVFLFHTLSRMLSRCVIVPHPLLLPLCLPHVLILLFLPVAWCLPPAAEFVAGNLTWKHTGEAIIDILVELSSHREGLID